MYVRNTLTNYTHFRDPFCHPPCTKATTLASITAVETDPNDLQAYFKACAKDRLNGVQKPFWDDWECSDPANFLTPEPLHHWHCEFYEHDIQWCMNAIGDAEIDFHFCIIVQPLTGQRHFAKGITTLKQVTGRVQRDLQCYIVGVIAGAAPAGVVRAVCALMDFRYLAQALIINDDGCKAIQHTLSEFHHYKQSIIAAGACCGESSNVLEHWQIPNQAHAEHCAQHSRQQPHHAMDCRYYGTSPY
ncbi:hypothetical protein HYDPIDRAFT_95739 [Hydnomerulius pinastri MD-312]|uniref:Uncharacterized protein n=1 Tax=Hydnomerulius pinastri MD-312 TaxID=994086 RepID=A0A0C9VV12_9AGAM|nr:hypothetical protein HYDPIDRAFT_95739 [Hydnomerulius pinastri MD-312]